MLTCKEVARLVSESLDRKLPLHQRLGVRLHLAMCGMCRRYSFQVKYLRRAIRRRLGEDALAAEPGERLSEEARERIKKSLAQH